MSFMINVSSYYKDVRVLGKGKGEREKGKRKKRGNRGEEKGEITGYNLT